MGENENLIGWCEIPVENMGRAISFYETVFNVKLEPYEMSDMKMAWFPNYEEGKGAGVSLVKKPGEYEPTQEGTVIYFKAPSDDISQELFRVQEAGGKLMSSIRLISERYGYIAYFQDTEGNRLGIRSPFKDVKPGFR